MDIPTSGLRVLLCVKSPQRAIGLDSLLKQMRIQTTVTQNVADIEKVACQVLPHLVICDALLVDGTIANVYDRLQGNSLLQKIPVVACVLKKSREELLPLAKRKFAAILLGQPDPKTLTSQIAEILKQHASNSPFKIDLEQSGLSKSVSLSIAGSAIGRIGDNLALSSGLRLDPTASVICKPDNSKLPPVSLKMATEMKRSTGDLLLFPLNRLNGRGRSWVEGLPLIPDVSGEVKSPQGRNKIKVLLFEPNPKVYQPLASLLESQNYEVLQSTSLRNTLDTLVVEQGIKCVYLHELLNDSSGIAWKDQFPKLLKQSKPTVIIATSSSNMKSTDGTIYLKRPCGIGVFLDTLKVGIACSQEIPPVEKETVGNIPVQLEIIGKLDFLDESGGGILASSMIAENTVLNLRHTNIASLWEGNTKVKILRCIASNETSNPWAITFEALGASGAKSRYLEKVEKFVKQTTHSSSAA